MRFAKSKSTESLESLRENPPFEELREKVRQGPLWVRIVSGSMLPVMEVGGTYLIAEAKPEELRRFDVVVFFDGHHLTSHYLWSRNRWIDKDQWIARSLSTGCEDVPFSSDQILGKVLNARIGRWRRMWLAYQGWRRGH